MPGLPTRDALADWRHVPSVLAFEGADRRAPFVSIAIPTFRRPDLLAESVRSAMAQRFERPFEIVIVDNDPDSRGAAALVAALPALHGRNVRYFVNAENIGMYPNHNRCIDLARGEWLSILNDDDLLAPNFLATMFLTLDRRTDIAGLVCTKSTVDERGPQALPPRSRLRRFAAAAAVEAHYQRRAIRRIPLSKLFWGPLVGNQAGFLQRRNHALELGGFDPADDMSADYFYYARFADRYGLWQHRSALATARIARNESAKLATLRSFCDQSWRLQHLLTEHHLPRWRRRLMPLMLARQRGEYRELWHTDVPATELEKRLALRLPPDRPILYRVLRLLMRGF